MKPKALKTERDCQAAVVYVAGLMEQPSPDQAELKLWPRLLVNYEHVHFPIATPRLRSAVDSLAGSLGKSRAPVSIEKMKAGAKSAIAGAGRAAWGKPKRSG